MKKISKRNYFLLGIILVVTIILVIFINNIIRNYKYLKVEVSPLNSTISQININELDMALSELNEVILYVGNATTKENRKLERELLKKITSEDLENYVYYCDVSKELNDLNKVLNKYNVKINKVPALIYFKNKEVVEILDSKSKKITSEDLESLVQKYQIGK